MKQYIFFFFIIVFFGMFFLVDLFNGMYNDNICKSLNHSKSTDSYTDYIKNKFYLECDNNYQFEEVCNWKDEIEKVDKWGNKKVRTLMDCKFIPNNQERKK